MKLQKKPGFGAPPKHVSGASHGPVIAETDMHTVLLACSGQSTPNAVETE